MAQQYSKEQLRAIFQSPFDQEAWKAILHNLFRAELIRKETEKITTDEDNEDGFYIGAHETCDKYRIGLFYFEIKTGSVAHKKVGLRNLVKKFINPTWGEFDAAIVVFDDKREWRLSFICDIKDVKTTPKRYTFVFGEHDNFYRTAIERFDDLQKVDATFENIRKAFSVEAISKDFFDEYRELYADFVQYITGKRYVKEKSNKWVERQVAEPNYQYVSSFEENDKLVRDYIKKMFGRIVFLYFLQRKGWLAGNRQYMHDLFANSDKKDNFLDGVLEPLFFDVLNEKPEYRSSQAKELPECDNIPYLNGGLFAKDEIDDRESVFPEEKFKQLFDFLDSYNFTIDENDPEDAEIGVDPEMLGRIFENLLEDNKDKGAFYTPKEIVDYMCRESIIAYINKSFPEERHNAIRDFIETLDASELSESEKLDIRKQLQAVRICDPAIGSGAFPMGLVNLLSKLYVAMKPDTDTSKMKRHIMEHNIYGVDIEKGAVDIARLRFWLAMIVEEKDPIPLPNLHFKIMQGNSLLESYKGVDLSDLTGVKASQTPIQQSLFDSDDSERKILVENLKKYYETSDHTERDRLFYEITNNVRRQLDDKKVILPEGFDPSENSDFFLWHTWFADVFEQGGFDIVIGNPPYIQLQKSIGIITKDKRGRDYEMKLGDLYENEKFSSFIKTGDIYCLFYEQGNKILKPEGHLCFITSNKWMRAGYGEKLRSFFVSETNPEILIDFGGVQVFENATVDANILLFSKGKNRGATHAATINKDAHNGSFNLSDFMRHNSQICSFGTDAWVILSPIELSIKRKIEAVGVPLKDWDIQINYGIKTGYNEAFIITTEKRDEILAACADNEERKRTEELIRPILRGRDIKRYGYDWANLWLINTHNGIKGKLERIHIEDYPAVKAHLDQYWDKISTRADKGDTPYNLRNCAYLDDFNNQKIAWAELSRTGNSFVLDDKKLCIGNTGYILTQSIVNREELLYLLGILNSRIVLYQIDRITTRLDNNGWRWLRQFVELLRIPPFFQSETISAIVNTTDISNQVENSELVNKIIYEYFGLSSIEIEYVNKSLKGY